MFWLELYVQYSKARGREWVNLYSAFSGSNSKILHILQLIGCSVSGLSTHQCADGCPSLICYGHPRDDVLTSGYMYSGKLQPYLHSESDVYMMLMDALLIHE